jgi:hypothetical protein
LIDELADDYEPPDIRADSNVRSVTGLVFDDSIPVSPRNVITVSSSYSFGCLVFTRNLHPETNETTLRALFTATFKSSLLDTGGLDYVDFNKGMDSVSRL